MPAREDMYDKYGIDRVGVLVCFAMATSLRPSRLFNRSAWLLPSGVQRVTSRTGTGELIHSRMVGYCGRLLFV